MKHALAVLLVIACSLGAAVALDHFAYAAGESSVDAGAIAADARPPIVVDGPGSAVGSGTLPAVTPTPPVADPLANPAEPISTVTKLWRSGAIPSAIIVAAFFTLVVLRTRVKWFAEHGWATWMSLAIGGLGMAVDAIQRGETPNLSMLMISLTTTLALAARMPAPKVG